METKTEVLETTCLYAGAEKALVKVELATNERPVFYKSVVLKDESEASQYREVDGAEQLELMRAYFKGKLESRKFKPEKLSNKVLLKSMLTKMHEAIEARKAEKQAT